jgi:hypothetical protein
MRQCFLFLLIGFAGLSCLRAQDSRAHQYIEEYKDVAVQLMVETGCPASIILAVAMHESAHGQSKIAQHLNNHFGIKGANSSTAIRSAYKGYASVEDSYADFIRYLRDRKGTKPLFEKHQPFEYKAWAKGIHRAGYAQSSSWANKVIAMIEKYDLHEIDALHPESTTWVVQEQEITPALAQQITYTVKKGDTLSHIARKYKLSVKQLMQLNQLKNTNLQIGQRLILTNET